MLKPKVLKIVMGGDGGIGKTTLTKVFCDNPYVDQIMTIGVDIHSKDVLINDVKQTLQIWDLSGQDQFRFLLPSFAMHAHGVVLGFDRHRRESFLNLEKWLTLFRSQQQEVPIFLIATKCDLAYHPTLNPQMALEFVKNHKLLAFEETSAKANINVDLPFRRLLEHLNNLPHNSASITFICDSKVPDTTKAPSAPRSPEQISQAAEPCEPKKPIDRCPYCNHPLRGSQIQLKQAGQQVLCHNCFKQV